MAEKQTLIDSIENGNGRAVKVHLQRFKGKDYVDVRIWIQGDDDEWKATPKGTCVHIELLPRLIEALTKAQDIIDGKDGAGDTAKA